MRNFFGFFFILLGLVSIGGLIYFGFDGKYGMNTILHNIERGRVHTDMLMIFGAAILISFRLSFYFLKNKKNKKNKIQ